MKVAKGYKKTELGEIPEDWHFKTFGEVMKGFSSGQTPSRSVKKFYTGKIPWITSGELNYNVITDTIEKITPEAATKTHLKTIPVGTFLMAITGLEAEGTRGSCGITGVEATTNQSCMALYPNEKELTTEYLFQFYKMYGNQLAFKYCQGTKQQSYTGKIAKTLPIIIPPTIEEQKAITKALKETDAFIADLEKLILKKQNIKQGTMQVLLTGQKRLKGFRKEWQVKKIKEVAESYSGGTPLTSNTKYYDGDIPWVVIADISKAEKYISQTEKTISKEGLQSSSAKLFKKGTVLFAMYASIGKCAIAKIDLTCNQAILGIQTKSINSEFLYYFLSFNEKKFSTMGQTGTQTNLNKEIVEDLDIPFPEPDEQIAIANIFSDMDNELEELQNQLSKYKAVKEGMMQNLLTGKVRLV